MRRLIFLILVGLLAIPWVCYAETWEEFQKMKAAGEESGLISKGGGRLKSKDIIIEGLKKNCQVTYQSDELHFHYGSPRLKDESRSNLQATADALKEAAKDPELSRIQVFYVDGHTCSIGTAENNCRLSWLRAQAVVDELVKLGVPREKLIPRGYGLAYPAHSNDTEETRMLNRRVVLKGDCPETKAQDTAVPCRAEPITKPSGSGGSGTQVSSPAETDTGPSSEETSVSQSGSTEPPNLIPMGKPSATPGTVKGFKKIGDQGAAQGPTGTSKQVDKSQKGVEEKNKQLPRGFKPTQQ